MEYRRLFAEIHRRPGLYGLDGSYAQFCVFVEGVDYGNDNALLTGFREWLIPRAGQGNNLVWRSLVLHLAFPGAGHPMAAPTDSPEASRAAVDLLFALCWLSSSTCGPSSLAWCGSMTSTRPGCGNQSWYQPG